MEGAFSDLSGHDPHQRYRATRNDEPPPITNHFDFCVRNISVIPAKASPLGHWLSSTFWNNQAEYDAVKQEYETGTRHCLRLAKQVVRSDTAFAGSGLPKQIEKVLTLIGWDEPCRQGCLDEYYQILSQVPVVENAKAPVKQAFKSALSKMLPICMGITMQNASHDFLLKEVGEHGYLSPQLFTEDLLARTRRVAVVDVQQEQQYFVESLQGQIANLHKRQPPSAASASIPKGLPGNVGRSTVLGRPFLTKLLEARASESDPTARHSQRNSRYANRSFIVKIGDQRPIFVAKDGSMASTSGNHEAQSLSSGSMPSFGMKRTLDSAIKSDIGPNENHQGPTLKRVKAGNESISEHLPADLMLFQNEDDAIHGHQADGNLLSPNVSQALARGNLKKRTLDEVNPGATGHNLLQVTDDETSTIVDQELEEAYVDANEKHYRGGAKGAEETWKLWID